MVVIKKPEWSLERMWDRGLYSLLMKHKFIQTLGKSVWRFLKLKLELLYNTAVLLLGIHQGHNDEERTLSLTSYFGKTVFLHAKESVLITCPLARAVKTITLLYNREVQSQYPCNKLAFIHKDIGKHIFKIFVTWDISTQPKKKKHQNILRPNCKTKLYNP